MIAFKDIYDDDSLEVLSAKFGGLDKVPEVIKTAQLSDSSDLDAFDYAFVGEDQYGDEIRKLATKLPGDTLMSTIYFLEGSSELPSESIEKVARELTFSCLSHGLDTPEVLLEKAGMTREEAYKAAGLKDIGREALKRGKQFVNSLRGEPVETAHKSMIEAAAQHGTKSKEFRKAEDAWKSSKSTRQLSGLVVASPAIAYGAKKGKEKVDRWRAERAYRKALAAQGYKVASLQEKPVRQPAVHTCLNGRYPVDTQEQVKSASLYFDNFHHKMNHGDRAEYATNLASRAKELSVDVSGEFKKYAAASPSMAYHINIRKKYANPDVVENLKKTAAALPLPQAIRLVEDFDRNEGLQMHWGRLVADPTDTVIGLVKKAYDGDGSDVLYDDYGYKMSSEDLKRLVERAPLRIKDQFGPQMLEGLIGDSEKIFKSLPDPHKQMIARMATTVKSGDAAVV